MGLRFSRRGLMLSACAAALAGFAHAASSSARATPFPLASVRLKPSIFRDAVDANRAYLMSLEPDRLLHTFRKNASLQPKGARYGGWEARGIAGHTLGHYLSACSLLFAQTGDEQARRRVRYIVGELAECQRAHGDAYVGGTTVERDGEEVDGKIVYEEIRGGEIDSNPFGLNGGWVPLYSWHKVHAGLLDANKHCDDAEALAVARGMGDYMVDVFANLDDAQMQRVLACEHGGINESFAELHVRTGDERFLNLARRFYHRAVLDPLIAQRDQLQGLHANTQIPKVIGLARLHEITGDTNYAAGAQFFWDAVVRHHSFVIGGNSEREFFSAPDVTASLLSDRTCEACNTYNMLRLTRHLWSWRQDGAYFDYYERAHLNHIMAHQHPETGMKVYFMPMTVGGRRQYSTPESLFWCCVGSGMESHAKHGESIYGKTPDTLFVNLFIPSSLDWAERGARFELDTGYPHAEAIDLTLAALERPQRFGVAMRLPAWCAAPTLALNGRRVAFVRRDGYAVLRRRWRRADRLTLTLPMTVRTEAAPDDPRTLALLSGPLVLSADLGPASQLLSTPAPALHEGDPLAALHRVEGEPHAFTLDARPAPLTLRPYFALYDRRTAPYLQRLSDTEWIGRETAFEAAQTQRVALDTRTVDRIALGESASETAHNYRARNDDLFSAESVRGRQAAWGVGNYFEADLAVAPGPLVLFAQYWGQEIDKNFEIKVDGRVLAQERRPGPAQRAFVLQEYPLPPALTRGKRTITVRFETRGTDALVYDLRVLRQV